MIRVPGRRTGDDDTDATADEIRAAVEAERLGVSDLFGTLGLPGRAGRSLCPARPVREVGPRG